MWLHLEAEIADKRAARSANDNAVLYQAGAPMHSRITGTRRDGFCRCGGALAELLLDACEPALGALPGVIRAIELVGAVGAVAGGEQDVGGAGFGFDPGLAGEGIA